MGVLMPIYEYDCTTCGETLEILQRDSAVRETCGDECQCTGETWGTGVLARKLSAHNTISGGFRADPAPPPSCGSCGMAPGSCGEG